MKEDAHVCDEIVISPFIPIVRLLPSLSLFFLSNYCDILFVFLLLLFSIDNLRCLLIRNCQALFLSSGYEGRFCQIPIDPCQVNPCENSGTCLPTMNKNFRCLCPENYSGRTCQIHMKNFCSSSPCLFNATCENLPNGYRCMCPTNEICDKSKILTKACSNTNQCIYGTCNTDGKCSCFPGWTGDFCSEDIDECLTNPCANQGTCYVR